MLSVVPTVSDDPSFVLKSAVVKAELYVESNILDASSSAVVCTVENVLLSVTAVWPLLREDNIVLESAGDVSTEELSVLGSVTSLVV